MEDPAPVDIQRCPAVEEETAKGVFSWVSASVNNTVKIMCPKGPANDSITALQVAYTIQYCTTPQVAYRTLLLLLKTAFLINDSFLYNFVLLLQFHLLKAN